jgi:hypothetical protein
MKKITAQAVDAFMNARPFKKDNTEVSTHFNITILSLFGNEIAYRNNDDSNTLSVCARGWLTNTTKDRLNGIPGVNIHQKDFQWYLNGEAWDGQLIDVKGLGV